VHFDVDVGGSYGVKRGIKHAVLAGYLARATACAVKLIEDRAENMHGGDFHGPDRIFDVELGYASEARSPRSASRYSTTRAPTRPVAIARLDPERRHRWPIPDCLAVHGDRPG